MWKTRWSRRSPGNSVCVQKLRCRNSGSFPYSGWVRNSVSRNALLFPSSVSEILCPETHFCFLQVCNELCVQKSSFFSFKCVGNLCAETQVHILQKCRNALLFPLSVQEILCAETHFYFLPVCRKLCVQKLFHFLQMCKTTRRAETDFQFHRMCRELCAETQVGFGRSLGNFVCVDR